MDESSVRWVLCAAIVLAVVCIGLTSATPAAAQDNGTVIEDFEDGQVSADGDWSWSSGTSQVSVVSNDTITGDYSGEVYSDNSFHNMRLESTSTYTPDSVGLRVNPQTRDQFMLQVRSSGSTVIVVSLDDGDLTATDNGTSVDTGFNFYANSTYAIEARNIDWSANTYDVYVNGHRKASSLQFDTNSSSIDGVLMQWDTRNSGTNATARFDDLLLNSEFPTVTANTPAQDGFEDGDIDPHLDGYTTYHSPNAGELRVTTDAINGTYSGLINSTGGIKNVFLSTVGGEYSHTSVRAAIRIEESTGNQDAESRFDLMDADRNRIAGFRFEDGGNVLVLNGSVWNDTGHDWTPGEPDTYEIANIDWQAQEYEAAINGTTVKSNLSFRGFETGYFHIHLQEDSSQADGRDFVYDDVCIGCGAGGGGGSASEDLQLNVPQYMPNGTEKPYEVLYNDSGVWRDVTSSATVTSSNASVVAVNGSMLEANENINDSRSSLITAEYDGLNATQRVYVAPTEVEHIDVMTIWWKVTTMLSDSTIWWLLVATAIAVAATRVTSAFAGVGAYTMTVICGWVVGDVTTGVMGATVLIGVFIALNVSENLRPAY